MPSPESTLSGVLSNIQPQYRHPDLTKRDVMALLHHYKVLILFILKENKLFLPIPCAIHCLYTCLYGIYVVFYENTSIFMRRFKTDVFRVWHRKQINLSSMMAEKESYFIWWGQFQFHTRGKPIIFPYPWHFWIPILTMLPWLL